MSGRIVNATNLDSVRIEVLGDGRAVTIPASLILAADRVFRFLLVEDEDMDVYPVEDARLIGWEARAGNVVGQGETPWAAVIDLADELTKRET